jgi:glyoxylase-like metal-dependent hydrolase (beta-lactamase superfamily II)
MADLLALSARIVDEGIWEGPGSVNRVTTELSEVGDGVALIEAFSHVVAFDAGEELVLFDASLEAFAPRILASLRGWSDRPVHTIAYTHGHVDHVGGAQAFVEEARERGDGLRRGGTRARRPGTQSREPRERARSLRALPEDLRVQRDHQCTAVWSWTSAFVHRE